MTLSARVIGAAAGLLVGLLFIVAGWRLALILLGFILVGFLAGWLFERRERVLRNVRDWLNRLPRS